MTLTTRKPAGLPTWPITLLAGAKSSGKQYTCLQASASPLVAQTFWVGFGAADPDDYQAVPGADIDIVNHNGTIPGLIAVLDEIADLPVPEQGVNLIVLHSGTKVWETIADGVQQAKLARGARAEAEGDKDLWDAAKADWQSVLDALRRHNGPSIITARFEESLVYVGGKPTGDKAWRIKAQSDLPYEVGAVIEMRERGDYTLTGVKSLRMRFAGPISAPEFTVDALWREMGLDGDEWAQRTYATPIVDQYAGLDTSGRDWLGELGKCLTAKQVAELGSQASTAKANAVVTAAIRKKHRALNPAPPTP